VIIAETFFCSESLVKSPVHPTYQMFAFTIMSLGNSPHPCFKLGVLTLYFFNAFWNPMVEEAPTISNLFEALEIECNSAVVWK
jgi:hypothetical protein